LKGKQNGIMDDPRFEVYMRHWYPRDPNIAEVPGEWRAEKTWPPQGAKTQTLFLTPYHTLTEGQRPPAVEKQELKYVPSIGIEAGFWWGDFTTDQRPIDAYSLVYDSFPLHNDTAILGWPKVTLQASSTAPLADWFVRLSDVAPDGTVTMITGAGQSGAQLKSASNPESLTPGKTYQIPIELHLTSWVFPAGHKIRVSISNALWPMIWPTPYAMTTSLYLDGVDASRLELPLVPLEPPARPRFPAVETAPAMPEMVTSTGDVWPPKDWTVKRDLMTGTTRVSWSGEDAGHYPWGNTKDFEKITYELQDNNPAVSTVHADGSTTVLLKNRTLTWSVVLNLRSDAKNFCYHFERHLSENGKEIRAKTWDETIPRDYQ